MSKLASSVTFLKETQIDWRNAQPSRMAAALAFRGMFSLAPLVLIVAIIITLIFDRQTAQEELADVLNSIFGPSVTAMLGEILISTAKIVPSGGLVPLLISLGVLFYGATALFYELKLTLNTIWGIPYSRSVGVFRFIRDRLIALLAVFGIGLLFVLIIVVNSIISILVNLFRLDSLVYLSGLVTSFGLITLVIAVLFKYLPDAYVAWQDIWIGALVTSLMLTIGVWAISIYLALSSIGAAYGAAGALMVILIFLYYSAHIFIVGASFTRSFSIRVGSQANIRPVDEQLQ